MNNLPKGITQAQFDEVVAKYGEGKVKGFDLPLDDFGTDALGVIGHEIDLPALGQYQQWSDKNWRKSNEILIRGVIVGKEVCDRICSDSGLFLAAIDAALQMVPIRKSIVKN